MTINTLIQRLERLETKDDTALTAPKADPLMKVLQVLVAYHLGNADPTDSIAGAMARGLGYDSSGLMTALRADEGTSAAEDLSARWRDAMGRLFALKGTAPDCDEPTFGTALEMLFSEMPERLQRHRMLMKYHVTSQAA